jgi:hypothetical protein
VLRTDFGRGLFEAVRVPSGENDRRAIGAGSPGGRQANACATTDQDDSLSKQFRFALRGLRSASDVHDTQAATNQPPTPDCRGSHLTTGATPDLLPPSQFEKIR